jgi:single-stranded-DNA-specific exonuclease
VADHHQPPQELPAAYALVNPKLEWSEYPYKELCGAFVGAKVIAATFDEYGCSGEEFLQRNLPLLALATVADVCPIDGENRILVARGLSAFGSDAPDGLIRMTQRAGLNPSEVSVYHLGFILGPRLNAAGRLESPKLAASLIMAKDEGKIDKLSGQLESLNHRRQALTNKFSEAAAVRIEAGECAGPIIILHDPDWHEGVIGLIASKMVDEFKRPALIATNAEAGFCKGSGRTSGRFDLLSAVKDADRNLVGYGGHSAAVGFKVRSDDFPEFVDDIVSTTAGKVDEEEFTKDLKIDGELGLGDLGQGEIEELGLTKPWGIGNEAPTFSVRGVEIIDCDTMGDGTHIRLRVRKDGKVVDAIGFGFNRHGRFLHNVKNHADLAAVPEINDFGGKRVVRLRLRDIKFG